MDPTFIVPPAVRLITSSSRGKSGGYAMESRFRPVRDEDFDDVWKFQDAET
jgi:hypothetical protein